MLDAAAPSGPIQRLDPRGRIVAALVFAGVVVSLTGLALPALALGVSVVALVLARLPAAKTLKRMAVMDTFILFMLLTLPFTIAGDPAFTLFGLEASWQGLWRALEIALKANAIVLMLLSLVGSMEPTTLGHALYRLRVPAVLIHLLLFTVRYIDVIHAEYRRLRTAMKARGFRPTNRLHTWRSFGYLVGMLLVRALERSERILEAMKCRGFTGKLILLDRLAWSRRDAVFAVVFTGAVALLLFLEAGRVPPPT